MANSVKGPWAHRFGVVFFTILAGVLFLWLLGFVVDDIGEIRGPQQADVEKRFLDPQLVSQVEEIEQKTVVLRTEIENQKARQTLLRDSTSSSQQTMNQLFEMQKLNFQNGVKPSVAEQNALAQSESSFIANQAQYQSLNEDIVRRSEEERKLEERKRGLEAQLSVQREAAAKELEGLDRRHRLRVAGLQLFFLIPILLIAVYLLLSRRNSMYAPLTYAFGIATLTKVTLVIHQNFPTRYFKYVLLLASIGVVVRVLVYLIQATASPKMAAVLKQYREAYERFLCPVCEYPIRRGPMRYSFWDRRSVRKLVPPQASAAPPNEPYTCPSCGSRLFEVCPSCAAVRHGLLPFCDQCGVEKPIGTTVSS